MARGRLAGGLLLPALARAMVLQGRPERFAADAEIPVIRRPTPTYGAPGRARPLLKTPYDDLVRQDHGILFEGDVRLKDPQESERPKNQTSVGCRRQQPGWQQRVSTVQVPVTQNGNQFHVEALVQLPGGLDHGKPAPVLLFFHGYRQHADLCGELCHKANYEGFITISVQGVGRNGLLSWNAQGTVRSPGPMGETCERRPGKGTPGYCRHHLGCQNRCADKCWWSTCYDSVLNVLTVLNEVERNFCVDQERIWASGFSNGGLMSLEMARDPRSCGRIAGVLPFHGLPIMGFNTGPTCGNDLHFFGNWGTMDGNMPVRESRYRKAEGKRGIAYDTDHNGWYFHTPRNVTEKWADDAGCEARAPLHGHWGVNRHYASGLRCSRRANCTGGASVVECLFPTAHNFGQAHHVYPPVMFMLEHSRSTVVGWDGVSPVPAPLDDITSMAREETTWR